MSSSALPHHVAASATPHDIARAASRWALLFLGCALFATLLPRAWNHINTDFPNYYVTAHLVRDGYATDRVYEWPWFARQKDRLQVDQPLSAFIPHTPLSGLVLVPLASFDPLSAKRVWIIMNVVMLAASVLLLAAVSGISWRWLAIAALFSFPAYRNFEYGQMYILILLLTVGALWAYLRDYQALAGVLIAIAAALKIFPILFLFYFLRKRAWIAIAGFAAGALAVTALCFAVYPTRMLSTFVTQIMPAALRGEGNDPFNLTASSISALMHHGLLYQSELNPHPWFNAPWALALLQPCLQLAVLGVAILLCRSRSTPARTKLEWAALLTAILASSAMPASYHFVLLLLPLAVGLRHFAKRKLWKPAVAIVFLCFLAGWPNWSRASIAVPRLWCVLLLVAILCAALNHLGRERLHQDAPWIFAMAGLAAIAVSTTFLHARTAYAAQTSALPASSEIFAAMNPVFDSTGLHFTAMTPQGWRLASVASDSRIRIEFSDADELSQAEDQDVRFVERTTAHSDIWIETNGQRSIAVHDGESPIIAENHRDLAFLRRSQGRASLWVHNLQTGAEQRLTPEQFDIYEAVPDGEGGFIFSATTPAGNVALYELNRSGSVTPLGLTNARYPVLSPDRQWLALAQLHDGHWHLTVVRASTHELLYQQNADCNDLGAAWMPDSRSLIVATDCGRGLWEPTLKSRTILP